MDTNEQIKITEDLRADIIRQNKNARHYIARNAQKIKELQKLIEIEVAVNNKYYEQIEINNEMYYKLGIELEKLSNHKRINSLQ